MLETPQISANRSRLTEEEYDHARARLRELHDLPGHGLRYEQELAILFHRSPLTQTELARREGVAQSQIAQQLIFGRFLEFITDGDNSGNPPFRPDISTGDNSIAIGRSRLRDVTERHFRAYWKRTDKSETNYRIRFRDVVRLMSEEGVVPQQKGKKRRLGTLVIRKFGDSKWHQLDEIAAALQASPPEIDSVLYAMSRAVSGAARCERKRCGAGWQYRIFPVRGRSNVPIDELITKLRPIIETLKTEGKKHLATVVVRTCEQQAILLQRQLDEWTSGNRTDRAAVREPSPLPDDE